MPNKIIYSFQICQNVFLYEKVRLYEFQCPFRREAANQDLYDTPNSLDSYHEEDGCDIYQALVYRFQEYLQHHTNHLKKGLCVWLISDLF